MGHGSETQIQAGENLNYLIVFQRLIWNVCIGEGWMIQTTILLYKVKRGNCLLKSKKLLPFGFGHYSIPQCLFLHTPLPLLPLIIGDVYWGSQFAVILCRLLSLQPFLCQSSTRVFNLALHPRNRYSDFHPLELQMCLSRRMTLPSKSETLSQCCFNVGPASQTLYQYWDVFARDYLAIMNHLHVINLSAFFINDK